MHGQTSKPGEPPNSGEPPKPGRSPTAGEPPKPKPGQLSKHGESPKSSASSKPGERPKPAQASISDDRADLLRGTLDLLILKALTFGPQHGYGIARWLEESSRDLLRIEEGSLYPALYRMDKKGWIRSEWGFSETNRKAKYYRLTSRGREQLASRATGWERFVEAMSLVLQRDPS